MTEVVAVIPARYGSRRLPGKPLLDVGGKPLVRWVWERACMAEAVRRVVVATDDPRVAKVVEGFGGEAVLTSPEHPSGTDRVAEVAKGLSADFVVNVQGDEPFLDPEVVDQVVERVLKLDAPMATAAKRLNDPKQLWDPSVVKVVLDLEGYALYFSRSPIPFLRDVPEEGWLEKAKFLRHIGIYAYRKDFLMTLSGLPPTPLELSEKLEQLRALEHGYKIAVAETEYESFSVDTPEDLRRAREMVCGR
ncbi:MAG: 3-deoxy-manno-octulosonate cytidylyltransferase [Candidatus Latescibacterota bacterium]|nr:MAG: 3-deoxy-manno-octulosonate cytidylyltransferase [Candidatus Latescibacterota bacterium]